MAAMAVASCDSAEAALRVADDAEFGFVPVPDVGSGSEFPCSVRTQNCRAGHKCMPSREGGGAWETHRCVPVADEPRAPGEPCTLGEPPWFGHDDCERGAMCWYVDPETGQGTCIAIHTGSSLHQICPNPLDAPMEWSNGVFLPCFARCNPLAPDCRVDEGCYGVVSWRADFVCLPDATQGRDVAGQPCEFTNACAPGFTCIGGADVPGCDGAGCCTPYCDLDDPDCPPGTDCQPWDPPLVVPGQENAGICRV